MFGRNQRVTRRRGHRFAAALAAAVLLAAGCGSGDQEETAGPSGAPETAQDAATLAPTTFDGEAVTIDGQPFDLGQLADSDLVLWFWAPW